MEEVFVSFNIINFIWVIFNTLLILAIIWLIVKLILKYKK